MTDTMTTQGDPIADGLGAADPQQRESLIAAFVALPALLDGARIAAATGVARRSVYQWGYNRGGMPPRHDTLNRGPVWRREQLEDLLLYSGRGAQWRRLVLEGRAPIVE